MSSEKITKPDNSLGWSGVISEAERQIKKAKQRIAALNKSILICREKLANQEP
jgi:hypothetical protein